MGETGEYIVRCMGCGFKMGTTDDPHDTDDYCDRCQP